ncbi:unnamed protein product [Soboliphyme baturini]|uniref:MFS domain-containing protein n=1 Tax=Soboliphyme baturini TaxID=241478 RepID=A0A183IKC4_9BILA|nr:unnamed protein product [Soboliphyme baturini]
MFYSTILFYKEVGLSEKSAQGATLGVGAMMVIVSLISTVIIDRTGRRTLLLIGLGGMGSSCVLLTVFMVLKSASYGFAAYLCVVFVITYVVAFGIGLGSIPWFLVHELFMPNAKPKANSIATSFNWGGAFLVGQLFPLMMMALQNYTFLVFAGLLLFFGLFTYKFVPETKHRTVNEIIQQMHH